MNIWYSITSYADRVPSAAWAALMVANLLLTIATYGRARRRFKRAGERSAHPERFAAERSRKRDVALTIASLVPAALFWGMVLAGSFHSLVAFGRNVLDWNGGAEYLVPGTLDGVSVTFAFLAFRAIHKHRDPSRCQRVVWAASLASAIVNFNYEYTHTHDNLVAGLYLAVLSVFGMVIFHEFLAQFEEGAAYIRRNKRPPWGPRWFTSPYSTACSAIAWENFPAPDGTPATVINGLANLEQARQIKRKAAEIRVLERHARNLADARRQAELAAARLDPNFVPAAEAVPAESARASEIVADADVPPSPEHPPVKVAKTSTRPASPVPTEPGRSDDPTADPRVVPTTPATVAQWAGMWVQMCADGDLVRGPLNDDAYARRTYGVSGRQLRNVRSAATSGALARRAAELGVNLPDDYQPFVGDRVNDHVAATVAG